MTIGNNPGPAKPPDVRTCRWVDHPANPLIEPPGWWEWLIADPTVVIPEESPDRSFHLFAHSLRGIHHYLSDDGILWRRIAGPLFAGLRPFIHREGNLYYLFYEVFSPIRGSYIAARTSSDLTAWSDEKLILSPLFQWEKSIISTNSNPCVVRQQGGYRLYYSAALVWLKDCYFPEPKYIAVAESDGILGPYRKMPEPIIEPSKDCGWRNLGAGAIKVLPREENGPWIGFNNGISTDDEGRSRSEIRILESSDGLSWTDCLGQAILKPEGNGWKKALVYAMDVRRRGNEWLLYYNARDGWFRGKERIGLAVGRKPL